MMTANNPNASQATDTQARFIVVHAVGSFREGDVIAQREKGTLEGKGGIALPFQPDFEARSGIGGYFKRSYGARAVLHEVQSRPVAKVTIFLDPKYSRLFWAARLEISPKWIAQLGKNDRMTGSLRLLPDGTQECQLRCIATPQGKQWEAREVIAGNIDSEGGLIIEGSSTVGVSQAGHYPFALYGFGDGIRVAWVAVTQA